MPEFASREGGAVVSVAITRYAYCSLLPSADNTIEIHADDLEQNIQAASIRELEFDGNLDLLKGAVKALALPQGFDVYVRSEAPPGSGTGSSASIGIALLGLLNHLGRTSVPGHVVLSRHEMAELACRIERDDLHIVGGKQDQYAAALGGFNYMQFRGAEEPVAVEPLKPSPGMLCELSKRLVLFYTGQSRLSGDTNATLIQRYEAGEKRAGTAIRREKELAESFYHALLAEDLSDFPDLFNAQWEARCSMAAGMVTPQMEQIKERARAAGALGAKVCGAGGGGCILLYCDEDREGEVRRTLAAEPEGGIIDFDFDFSGLQVWEAK
jgi:D-glycero-alpha-D-manno-heptose-7-phosphate kinase